MVVIEAFKTRGNRCRTWSYNDFSLYAVHRPDGLPLGSNRHQSVKYCYASLIPALLTDCRAEPLMKAGRTEHLRYFLSRARKIDEH